MKDGFTQSVGVNNRRRAQEGAPRDVAKSAAPLSFYVGVKTAKDLRYV